MSPDVHKPPPVSSAMQCNVSLAFPHAGTSNSKGKKSGCNRLPDMRSPSALSLAQLRYSSCGMKSNFIPSKKLASGRLPHLHSPSSAPRLCDVGTQPSVGPNYLPHYSWADTRSRQNRRELLPHTIKTRVSASPQTLKTSFKTTSPNQGLANQQFCETKHSTVEENCLCEENLEGTNITDQIPSPKPRVQASRKIEITTDSSDEEINIEGTVSKWLQTSQIYKNMSIDSASEEDGPCDDIKVTDRIDQISNEEYFPYDDVESTDSIQNEILPQKERLQANRHSKKSTNSAYDCPCDYGMEGTDSISDEISSRKTQLKARRKSKISISSDDEEVLGGEIKGMDIIPASTIGGVAIRKPRHQSSQMSKMPSGSADGYHCQCEDIEGTFEFDRLKPAYQFHEEQADEAPATNSNITRSGRTSKPPVRFAEGGIM